MKNRYCFVKCLLGAHDGRAPIKTPNPTMQLQTIVQNLKVHDFKAKVKVKDNQESFKPCCWLQQGQSSHLPGFSWRRARRWLPTQFPFGWFRRSVWVIYGMGDKWVIKMVNYASKNHLWWSGASSRRVSLSSDLYIRYFIISIIISYHHHTKYGTWHTF